MAENYITSILVIYEKDIKSNIGLKVLAYTYNNILAYYEIRKFPLKFQ